MKRLNEDIIRENINSSLPSFALHDEIVIHILDSIDSTNRFLKNQKPSSVISICCAETQTNGQGRMGRSWHSPYGENIYFSIRIPVEESDVHHLTGLSLVASLAVIDTLRTFDLHRQLSIKWPNDILWEHKKLSGCLIELIKAPSEVIIGIGINVNSKTFNNPLPDKEWCSLFDITNQSHDRNPIIGKLTVNLIQHLNQLIKEGFSSFTRQWQKVDNLKGKPISLIKPSGIITGVSQGIDQSGCLIIIDETGKTHVISSGDATLKAQ